MGIFRWNLFAKINTGCSLNIVGFFANFKIYSGLWPLSVFPPAWTTKWQVEHQSASAKMAEFRKITTFLGKNTLYKNSRVMRRHENGATKRVGDEGGMGSENT